MKFSDYKILGIILTLVGVIYFMNRTLKFLKSRVSKLEEELIDNNRELKNIQLSNEKQRKLLIDKPNREKFVADNSINQKLANVNANNEFFNKKLIEMENIILNLQCSKNEFNNDSQTNFELSSNVDNDINVLEYDLSEDESELDPDSDNIAIYSNDNEENNFSNSDIDDETASQNKHSNDDRVVMVNGVNKIDSTAKERSDPIDESKNLILNSEGDEKHDVSINEEDSVKLENYESGLEMNLTELLKLKLNALQCMAEENQISIENELGKKKTKKDLANELIKLNSKNLSKTSNL